MTTNPPDEPREPGTPPPPPSGAPSYDQGDAAPPPGHTPPTGGYQQPAGGYQQPPAYGQQPGYSGPPPGGQGYAQPLSDSDQRMWATLGHIGGILLGFVAPLVVWLIFKDRGRFVDDQAKEALNFQIAVAIGYVISTVLMVIGIGVLLFFAVWIVSIIFAIIAAVAANKGEAYRYPVTLRLIK